MDSAEFREFGRAAVDFLADYYDNIRERDVLPSIQPGYLKPLLPEDAPEKGESWRDVMADMERVIMPGVTHWHSPHFHAYFPTASSYPGIVGEMMSAGLGVIGFNWIASPACTELEVVVMNWLGKMLGLPDAFLSCSGGEGGGVIQNSASEATIIAMLAAKERKVRQLQSTNPDLTEGEIKGKLIAYSSDQSNSSVEKSGLVGSMPMRLLPSNEKGQLEGKTLRQAVLKDLEDGLLPCYVVANVGTTGTCAFDDLEDLGIVCEEFGLWMHVDAAYAGAALVLPEHRGMLKGVEYAESFDMNPHKWMLVNFDCSAMWVKKARYLVEAFNVQRIYLKHNHEGSIADYHHWQLALGRRFRSLKLWFVLRIYGVEGIQKHIQHQIGLAKHFAKLMTSHPNFQVVTLSMGLVTFRLKGDCSLTKTLLDKIMEDKRMFMVPCKVNGLFVIRFAICSRLTTKEDVERDYGIIAKLADGLVEPKKIGVKESVVGIACQEEKIAEKTK